MRKIIFFVAFSFSTLVMAQVGIGIKKSHPRAILHLEGKKGVLFPKINTKERDALIKNSPEGLILYNPQNKCLEFWNGANWVCTYNFPSPIPLRLNCGQISVEGVFVKNAISFPKITLDVNYDGLEEGEIGVTDLIRFESDKSLNDAVLFSSREGVPIGPDVEMPLTVTGGKDITVDHLGIHPKKEGTVRFNISTLGQICPVKIDVQKEEDFTVVVYEKDIKVIEDEFKNLYPEATIRIHPKIITNDTASHSEVYWSIHYIPQRLQGLYMSRVEYNYIFERKSFEEFLNEHKIDLKGHPFLDKKMDYMTRIYFSNGSYISKEASLMLTK